MKIVIVKLYVYTGEGVVFLGGGEGKKLSGIWDRASYIIQS